MEILLVRINFVCNPVFQGWHPHDTRLGGTEMGAVEWAEELSKCGHEVVVYRNTPENDPERGYFYRGAHYEERSNYDGIGDININIKSSDIVPNEYSAPVIYYTNETDADKKDLSKYDAVIHISQWAKDNIPVNNSNVFVIPHGYDPKEIYPAKKIDKQCLYASSPDRGLDTLLEAWPRIYQVHPDATLLVTYGVEGIDLPGVTCLGDVDESTMNELYRTSDIWCHPANGGELFCITGIKAQAAGCVPVYNPIMALQETVKHGFKTNKENYAQTLTYVLDHPEKRAAMRDLLSKETYPTIEYSTQKLLNVIESVIGE